MFPPLSDSAACRLRRALIASSAASGVLLVTPAYALPTPDVVASVVNVVPLLAGAIATGAGGLLLELRRRFGSRRGDFVSGLLVGLVPLILFVSVWGVDGWTESRRADRAHAIASYLRCDFAAHVLFDSDEANGSANFAAWNSRGNLSFMEMPDVAESLRRQPDAAFLATHRQSIEYHAGIPAVQIDDRLVAFDHVRLPELAPRISEVHNREIYLVSTGWIFEPPSRYPGLAEQLTRFDRVFLIDKAAKEYRYVRDAHGVLFPARADDRVIDWPFRYEGWLIDQRRIAFPGITELLGEDDVAEYMADDETIIVAAFDHVRRPANVYVDRFLGTYFGKVEPERVVVVDLGSPTVSLELTKASSRLDGKRFVVVGISKYDWLYDGIEFAFLMWESLGHDPERFRLVGFSDRLPEAVALSWTIQGEISMVDLLAKPFWSAVGALVDRAGLTTGAAIFLLAILLRGLLAPIGMLESRSRIARARIRSFREQQGPGSGLWAPALERLAGVRPGWEIIGAALTLTLLLPSYRVLTGSKGELTGERFLWIGDLAAPDLGMSIAIGALVALKLLLSPSARRIWPQLAAGAGFALLLISVQAGVLVYAAGVLLVTVGHDLLERHRSARRLRQALLLAPA